MVRNTLPLFRVRGVEVGVHVSWLIVFALITWSLAMGFVPQILPGVSSLEAWIIGAISAVLLFASVLLHELAHSFVAISRGLPVHSITLFLFGGVSNLTADSKDPRSEFAIAIVGPLTSFAIAGAAVLASSLPLDERVGVVITYLIVVNALLGVFNLIPGFPLDGGRVLRSIVWSVTGNVRRATEVAASVGQLVGLGLIGWGVVGVVGGDLLGGLWTAAIGLFLQNAAGSSVQQVALDARLRNVRVRDAFTVDTRTATPEVTISELIEHYILGDKRRAVLVSPDRRAHTIVREVMTGPEGLVTTSPETRLREAAEVLAQHDFDQLPVVENGRPVGAITRADILREFQIRETLDLVGDAASAHTDLLPGTQPGSAG
jgi:Zn-dependent protease